MLLAVGTAARASSDRRDRPGRDCRPRNAIIRVFWLIESPAASPGIRRNSGTGADHLASSCAIGGRAHIAHAGRVQAIAGQSRVTVAISQYREMYVIRNKNVFPLLPKKWV